MRTYLQQRDVARLTQHPHFAVFQRQHLQRRPRAAAPNREGEQREYYDMKDDAEQGQEDTVVKRGFSPARDETNAVSCVI